MTETELKVSEARLARIELDLTDADKKIEHLRDEVKSAQAKVAQAEAEKAAIIKGRDMLKAQVDEARKALEAQGIRELTGGPVAEMSMLPNKCPKCGAEIHPGDKYCMGCGCPVAKMRRNESPTCAFCKKNVPAGAKFCPFCGKALA